MLYFFCFLSLLFSVEAYSPRPLFFVPDFVWYDTDFYEEVFKDEWEGLRLTKKESVFNGFLVKELACYLATKEGFHYTPKVSLQLEQRRRALLINNTYEHLVARPFFPKKTVAINSQNLLYKAKAFHLLIGYKGSTQNTDAVLSQEEALFLIDSLYIEIQKEVASGFLLEEVFSEYALNYSIDPSVKTNRGFLGWVPWGKTVMSFQAPLFALKPNIVSSPVLTEYGYHLILKTDSAFSNFYYYNKKNYLDLAYRAAQNSVNLEGLRSAATAFDSLLIKQSSLVFNFILLDSVVFFLQQKQNKTPLMGSKALLVSWLKEFPGSGLFFIKNTKGFGLSWLTNRLKGLPKTRRIPTLKTKQDLKKLVLFLTLEEQVLLLSRQHQIDTTSSFLRDWTKNYKSILYGDYLTFLFKSLSKIDSSQVLLEYERGLYNQKYIKPERVVFSEIRVFTDSARASLKEKQKTVVFDSLLVMFGGALREPISSGAKSPLAKALFSLSVGEVSPMIKNSDGSFSLARVKSFLAPEPFTLSRVYTQIERKLIKAQQDSVQTNLLRDLLTSIQTTVNYTVLGLE